MHLTEETMGVEGDAELEFVVEIRMVLLGVSRSLLIFLLRLLA